jgi:hypothetical protein
MSDSPDQRDKTANEKILEILERQERRRIWGNACGCIASAFIILFFISLAAAVLRGCGE